MQRDVHHGLLALFAVALAAASTAACQKDASLDPFIGPSELALSLALSATPDVLPLDGASQSLVSILARDGSGQVLANVTLRLQIRFGGVLQDYGQLSGRTLVTGQDGRAVATYTAPLAVSGIDADAQVQIEVTPIGDNYASAVPRSLTIRLVPSGVVIPPFTITAGFRFTPSSPARFQEVLFETNCLSATDANCVTDASGQIASYTWSFGDGSTASGPTATHSFSSASTFTVKLTVTDAYSRSTSASRSVTVGTGGTPTAAFAFSPALPRIGDTVFFNASASTAPAGRSIVSYAWAFGDGDTGSGGTVSHAFAVAATYGVTLTVTDDRGVSASTTTSVIVATSQPTASFVFSPTAPTTTTAVRFNAGASSAASGRTITSYAWNFGDGGTATGVTPTHTFATAGDYNVVLTVTDTQGEVGTSTASVTVVAATSGSPTASFVFSPSAPPTTTTVQFNAAASTAPAGRTITGYAWNFGDSSTGTGVTTSHTFTTAGIYNVVLTVTDSDGATGTISSSVTVTAASSPTASFVFSPTAPTTATLVQFNAAASTSPAGTTITGYAWNFGDGSTATGVTTSHTFTTAGVYNVALTVTDSAGATGTTSSTVTVTAATAGDPTASFVFSPTAPTTTTAVQFNATASTAPAGLTITGYAWNFGDGSTGTGVTTSHTFTTAGVYNVALTVTDSSGATGTTATAVAVVGVSSTLPTASFTVSPSPSVVGGLTVVDATASIPSNGATILFYTWNFGDSTGTTTCPAAGGCNGAIFSHTYAGTGTFTITLEVEDSLGLTDTTTRTITVTAVPDPTASFTASPNPATLSPGPATVNFNGSASSAAPSRTIATWEWDFGDGTTVGPGAFETTTHEYMDAGTFTVSLTVVDSATAEGQTTVEVTIDP